MEDFCVEDQVDMGCSRNRQTDVHDDVQVCYCAYDFSGCVSGRWMGGFLYDVGVFDDYYDYSSGCYHVSGFLLRFLLLLFRSWVAEGDGA